MSSALYSSSGYHYRCGVAGCWRERMLSPVSAYLCNYCEEHTCAIASCEARRENGVHYCEEHRCWYAECPQPSMIKVDGYDSPSRACPDHTCQVENCTAAVTLDSAHCEPHTCLRKGCPKPKDPNSPVCPDHGCTAPGCVRQRRHRRGSEACSAHTCRTEGCYRAQLDGSARPHCAEHTCKWAFKACPRARPEPGEGGVWSSEYCDSHRCVIQGCPLPCRRSGRLCADHGCWFDTGVEGAECASGPKALGRFCAAHTCRVRRCLEAVVPAVPGQQQRRFCAAHSCAWPVATTEGSTPSQPPCPMRRRSGDGGGGGFCEGHECAQRGCPRAREVETKPFCSEHEIAAKERRATAAAAATAAQGSMVERSSRRGAAVAAATAVPPGQLAKMFQEDPRAVYAMAYTQGWEGRGGRERYDTLRTYLDGAMESQFRMWALETDGSEENRMLLHDPIAEEVRSPVPQEMRQSMPTDSPVTDQTGSNSEPALDGTAQTTA